MYIKDITIEGFKSYARRVHVANFDPKFNAITGLNGSGKSNILDAVCFVLGITNLSHVRAGSLLDLVYKKGQAGVTEAVVCVTFDNRDKSRSPVGFEDKDVVTVTRQIVVGGRNKYRLNGRQATATQVQEFFRGVQLNVNNPHFLIMQGRITQVLNMKPQEILGMLEEVAGTRMYEEKRVRAFQTFEKKTQQLREFDEVMSADLRPTLQRLKGERHQLLQFTKAQECVQTLEPFCIAFDYISSQEKLKEIEARVAEFQARQQQLENDVALTEGKSKETANKMTRLEQKIEQQFGSNMYPLQAQSEELSRAVSQAAAAFQVKRQERQNLLEEIQQLKDVLKQSTHAAVEAKERDAEEIFQTAQLHEAELSVDLKELERELGQFGKGGPSRTLLSEKLESIKVQQVVSVFKGTVASACGLQLNLQSRASETEIEIASLEGELGDLRRHVFEGPAVKGREQMQTALQAIQHLTQSIEELGFEEERIRQVESALHEKEQKLAAAKDELRQLGRSLGDLQVTFDNPHVDRAAVKGIVGSLLSVKQRDVVTALEVAGGSKLKHLVVDSVETASAILRHGKLKRKVTILPMDKIRSDPLSSALRRRAEELFGLKAAPAVDFVDFDPVFQSIMQYTFGQTYVCKDSATAKAMAYHPEIRCRCVTLEGNDYSPSGLLTSGHRSSKGSILQPLHDLSQAEAAFQSIRHDRDTLQGELQSLSDLMQKFTEMKMELEVHEHSAAAAKEKIEGRERQLQQTEMDLERKLHKARHRLAETQSKLQHLREEQSDLAHQLQHFDGNEVQYMAQIQAKAQSMREKLTQAQADLKVAEKALHFSQATQLDASKDRMKKEEHLNALQEDLRRLEDEISGQQETVHRAEVSAAAAAAKLEDHKAKTRQFDETLKQLGLDKQRLEELVRQQNSERRNINNREGHLRLDGVQLENHLQTLSRKFPWIAEERHLFGEAGTNYDWSVRDPKEALAQYRQSKAIVKKIGNYVDPSVMAQFENTQNEYMQLQNKHKRVVRDRKNIEEAISDLDSKKGESIRMTWEKVNREFGAIFGTLLPGAHAKLAPPEGKSYLEGLEIRVALGGIWKPSLSELSGGQRSLLALSLILSILLFKPAPFYILDEVDAALDLSHTQNIGQMIQRFFPQSQFIVVSLKEGMFSNANVLFRTKFSDGISTVSRTVPERTN